MLCACIMLIVGMTSLISNDSRLIHVWTKNTYARAPLFLALKLLKLNTLQLLVIETKFYV